MGSIVEDDISPCLPWLNLGPQSIVIDDESYRKIQASKLEADPLAYRYTFIAHPGGPMSAAAKYELKNPATSRAAELNIMSGTLGPDVLDISPLARDLGVFTYDPAFTST